MLLAGNVFQTFRSSKFICSAIVWTFTWQLSATLRDRICSPRSFIAINNCLFTSESEDPPRSLSIRPVISERNVRASRAE